MWDPRIGMKYLDIIKLDEHLEFLVGTYLSRNFVGPWLGLAIAT